MDDADFLLNISVPTYFNNTREKEKNELKWTCRSERIKARRSLKNAAQQKANLQKATSISTYDEHIDSSRPVRNNNESVSANKHVDDNSKKRKLENNEASSSAVKKQKIESVHFSSLFNRNPDIPTIETKHVESIKEQLFSADSFDSLPLDTFMQKNLRNSFNFTKMTTVQRLAIPTILAGKDTLIKSHTGTGKTLAYAIPIIQTLQAKRPQLKRSDGCFAIVIVPTRELAIQSFETFKKLVNSYLWIVPGCTIGGEKRKSEKARFRKGITVLIGTPGRLADHLLHTQCLLTDRVQYLVIDEADRLHDMGFEKEVKLILSVLNKTSPKKQTILLSATLTEGVEKLAGISLSSPERIDASKDYLINGDALMKSEDLFSVPEKLKQHFIIVPCKLRLVSLVGFIASKCVISDQKSKMIVFLSTQDSVEFHFSMFSELFHLNNETSNTKILNNEGNTDLKKSSLVKFYKLHGNMPQEDRTKTFRKYSLSKRGVLLCTDVAARGLDLANVKWIVQYTTPGECKDYIHRVGRTARAGTQGNSILFLMPSETAYIKALNDMKINLKEINVKRVLEELLLLLTLLPKCLEKNRRTPYTFQEAATTFQVYFENYVHSDPDMFDLAKKAFQSFVRAYSTYPKAWKYVFHVKFLHIGHLAKSFGLRDAPSQFSNNSSKKRSKHRSKQEKRSFNQIHRHPRLRFDRDEQSSKISQHMSEYSDGYNYQF